MQTIKRSHVVPYSAQQMYQLVDDINNYKNFIDWCSQSEEHQRDDNSVTATLAISVHGIQKSFTTKNTLQPHSLIELNLVDGPFSHLQGFWKFQDLAEGCKVDFELNFEIANKLVAMVIGPMFENAASTMLDLFCKQAAKQFSTHDC